MPIHFVHATYVGKVKEYEWVATGMCACQEWQGASMSNKSQRQARRNLYQKWRLQHGRHFVVYSMMEPASGVPFTRGEYHE
jgi:hypothetical protein